MPRHHWGLKCSIRCCISSIRARRVPLTASVCCQGRSRVWISLRIAVLVALAGSSTAWFLPGAKHDPASLLGERGLRSIMAVRGTANSALGVLGTVRPARYGGAFAAFPSSFPPSSRDHAGGYRHDPFSLDMAASTASASSSTRRKSSSKAKAAMVPGTGSNSPRNVLVIVESPAKARTISQLLKSAASGAFDGYTVDACNGHVRDLVGKRKDVPPELKEKTKKWDVIGVDVENSFEPLYIPQPSKKAVVARLKKAASKADEIILATDEDREGEAISWHLLQVLKPKVPVKRAVFHEITQEALVKAFERPGDINDNLVQAQEARRILDRLAGFTLTPVVWSLIAPGLSAGRVQSVALSMVVERERRRLLFKPAEYWDVVANVTADGAADHPFEARLVQVGTKAVVTGKDFDPDTGELKKSPAASTKELLDAEGATGVAACLSSLEVLSVDKRRVKRDAPAPFITSTLQQEASRKLRLGVAQTMRAAQGLYEAGYITYMRTDRPTLSEAASAVAKGAVRDSFGEGYVRQGEAKMAKVKGSQEAHEAIRPALLTGRVATNDGGVGSPVAERKAVGGAPRDRDNVGTFLHPSELPEEGLERQQRALYDLVYRRTLASAMAESEADFTTVSLGAGGVKIGEEEVDVVFKATGKTTIFDGFLRAYEGGRNDEGPGDGESREALGKDAELPPMVHGDQLICSGASPVRHCTSPPRRFSEATFIKELEAQGVGRPSTYAAILETLRNRAYVTMQGRSLTPSLTGFVVASLLREHFPDFTDTRFTARMEDKLDQIARGKKGRVEYLSEYYLGEDGLKATVESKKEAIDPLEAKRVRLPGLEMLDDRCAIFVGPYGGYLVPSTGKETAGASPAEVVDVRGAPAAVTGEKEEQLGRAVTLPYVAQDNLELLTADLVERCMDSSYKGGDLLGQHPDTGQDIRIRMGRYGPYLECGDARVSAIAHPSMANVRDPNDLSLPSQPALLGSSTSRPSSMEEKAIASFFPPDTVAHGNISAEEGTATNGAFTAEDVIAFGLGLGSGVATNGSEGAQSIAGAGDDASWYSAVSLERAVGLLSLPKVVCVHPTDGGPIEVGIGRFGVYVKHNDLYKMVPKGVDALDVDEEMAVRLVDELIQWHKDRPTVELGVLDGEKVLLKYGRWGKFIYCAGTKANIPAKYQKAGGEQAQDIGLQEAIELIEMKRSKDPAPKRSGRAKTKAKKTEKSSNRQTLSSSARGKSADSAENEMSLPPRPLSGFFRFCRDCREAHGRAGINGADRTHAQTTPLTAGDLSERWKALTEGERAGYNAAAASAMEEWRDLMGEGKRAQSAPLPRGRGSGGDDVYLRESARESSDGVERDSNDGGTRSSEEQREGYEQRAAAEADQQRRLKPPKTAYLLFTHERRPQLKEQHGYPPAVMMSKLAEEWRSMQTNGGREAYERRAAELKRQWLIARDAGMESSSASSLAGQEQPTEHRFAAAGAGR